MTISKGELLKKIIEKAVKNGWTIEQSGSNEDMTDFVMANLDEFIDSLLKIPSYYSIIFDHDFAKAFWNGKTLMCDCCKLEEKDCLCSEYECQSLEIGWRHHLKRMVVSENPIKYLSKFL